jgi:hypothetical protein
MTSAVHVMHPQPGVAAVRIENETALIDGLTVVDATVVALLATAAEAERAELATRMLTVGAHGMTSMGIGLDLAAIDTRVHDLLDSVTSEAETSVRSILDESQARLGEQFDPEQRSSILARALVEFTDWRDEFLTRLDPGVEGSTATVLLQRVQDLVGPDGTLERRLTDALDLDAGDSALARLNRSIGERFEELRRDLAGERAADEARNAESERGTAHGIEFEDVVEANLRQWAASTKGCIVERTSSTAGELTALSKVGDFVVTLGDGRRIVVEAKRQGSISLNGASGILSELDAAIANRRAVGAVCIAGRDAFPTEVGHFNVYGDRVLAVDEGDGAMLAIAMQWVVAATGRSASTAIELDTASIADRIDRIRKAAESLSSARRSVTAIRGSLDKLHDLLGGLRGEVLDQADDLDRLLSQAPSRESRGSEGSHS